MQHFDMAVNLLDAILAAHAATGDGLTASIACAKPGCAKPGLTGGAVKFIIQLPRRYLYEAAGFPGRSRH